MRPSPREWQRTAVPIGFDAVERRVAGVIRAATGAGKSAYIGELSRLRLLAGDKRIVVATPAQNLVEDLAAAADKRMPGDVGQFYGKRKDIRRVTVACFPSLPRLAGDMEPPDVLIVDECHESECDTFLDLIPQWTPMAIHGVTATPWRADTAERLSLFDTLLFNYGPNDAIRDGVVVPPVLVHPNERLQGLEINDICLAMIKNELAKGSPRPGVVDAINITDAKEFAGILKEAGISAEVVHSKLHADTVKSRIAKLEAARLEVIVHVQMLSRGVDIPCLRWLCCRRPIGSRTLFAQYIGRGIRTYPGKTECRVLDPHDLFNRHSLTYEAVLGAGEDEDDVNAPALRLDMIVDQVRSGDFEASETLAGVPVAVIDPAASYIRRMRHEFEVRDVIPFDRNPAFWRTEPVTRADVRRIEDRIDVVYDDDTIPEEHRRALKIAYRAIRRLADSECGMNRGTASDFNKILKVLAWKGWPVEMEGVEA